MELDEIIPLLEENGWNWMELDGNGGKP